MQDYKLCHNCTAESAKCFQFGPTPHSTKSVDSILALLRSVAKFPLNSLHPESWSVCLATV